MIATTTVVCNQGQINESRCEAARPRLLAPPTAGARTPTCASCAAAPPIWRDRREARRSCPLIERIALVRSFGFLPCLFFCSRRWDTLLALGDTPRAAGRKRPAMT